MKKFSRLYFKRVIAIGLILLLQLILVIFFSCYLYCCFGIIKILFFVAALVLSLRIASLPCSIPCRNGWIIGILSFPEIFIPIYFMFGRGGSIRKVKKYISENPLPVNKNVDLFSLPRNISKQFFSLSNSGNFEIYQNTKCTYLKTGEEMFEKIKSILEKAQHYIFMEFFIIKKGTMWNDILNILKRKSKEGVRIYLLIDDLGTICLLRKKYIQELELYGIKCRRFNVFNSRIKPDINYRDHRKIVVLDGKYAITGGANIADEYINKEQPYGYWKDTAVYMEGDGADGFVKMFIQMWNMNGGTLKYEDYSNKSLVNENDLGLVIPFEDYPSSSIGYSESTFINMINNAEKYVFVTTPYLIPDQALVSSLCRAAESGCDVRMITPLIPDKKYIHIITRANYIPLLKSGVKIYEYTPGFIHAKSLLCDGNIGYVGSSNLDYRSLYLHFECGVLMYNTQSVKELDDDFHRLFTVCQKIRLDNINVIKAEKSFIYRLLRIFSSLL